MSCIVNKQLSGVKIRIVLLFVVCLPFLLNAQQQEGSNKDVKVFSNKSDIKDNIQNRTEFADSAFIRIVKLFEGEKFKIKTRNGKEYKGRVYVQEYGIEIVTVKAGGSRLNKKSEFVNWKDIERLHLESKKSIFPKMLLSCASFFVVFLLLAMR